MGTDISYMKLWPVFSSLFLISLLGGALYWWQHQNKVYDDYLIINTVTQLGCIFDTIDATAGISSFEHDKNNIDFLTVKSFIGSEVGSMNLVHPKKWKGPYLSDNPTMQEKLYQIVKTKDGYWIMPGDGVKLGNGNVMGKDIIISPQSTVDQFIDQGLVSSSGKLLGRAIMTGGKSATCKVQSLKPFSPEVVLHINGY